MKALRILFHIARADFYERSRRSSFLITLAVMIYIAYAYLPPVNSAGVTFNLGGYRGIYNSAWVGAVIAVLCSAILSLPGFFLIKNTIERDNETKVGQILATTPISRVQYILGKMFSNFVFLSVMVIVIMAAGLVMQVVRGESSHIDLWNFASPFIFTTFPVMALVSAVAILFETISWLRQGFGNIAYFFIYLGISMASIFPAMPTGNSSVYRVIPDPFGLTALAADMSRDVKAVFPDYSGGLVIGYSPLQDSVKVFEWDGVAWDGTILSHRLLWFVISIGIVLAATVFFHRFDPAMERRKSKKETKQSQVKQADALAAGTAVLSAEVRLTPLTSKTTNPLSLFIRTLVA
ncbi:MAG: hypothetical protein EHM41_22100, partial [Chloroflexi bacterium]